MAPWSVGDTMDADTSSQDHPLHRQRHTGGRADADSRTGQRHAACLAGLHLGRRRRRDVRPAGKGRRQDCPPADRCTRNIIRFAVVADPQGAGFCQGLSSDSLPPVSSRTPGAIGWRELMATEWKSAAGFHCLKNCSTGPRRDLSGIGPMGTYQLFATGAEPVGGMMTKPDAVPVPGGGLLLQRRRHRCRSRNG